ncbi:hypothetical protein QG516_17810 [Pedobacter gandavensis]|uniref:hypothetical protein n=1 Tax=Pedobacter TaxID=84567 RepID=UPI001C9A2801|nr:MULTISPECIES: hypothetical protein [Pedobacter]WGQ08393.1 hypothetical protein QG516_17810 [Pedobacter gandavensis]
MAGSFFCKESGICHNYQKICNNDWLIVEMGVFWMIQKERKRRLAKNENRSPSKIKMDCNKNGNEFDNPFQLA